MSPRLTRRLSPGLSPRLGPRLSRPGAGRSGQPGSAASARPRTAAPARAGGETPAARAELAAAGITDPALRAAYLRCRALNAEHGRTYFLATRLLTPDRRPAVHALYGFARWADDIVDHLEPAAAPTAGGGDAQARTRDLSRLERVLHRGLLEGRSSHPVVAALADTAARYRIDHRHFADFMASMRMDLTTTDYATAADLARYTHGSAAVIGLQVLPVLGTAVPREEAAPHAASLGVAFQLTNFLRDVGEDLDRGRIYLPADRLAAHGVGRDLLLWCRATGRGDSRVRAALRDLIAENRAVYRHAERGVPMLAPVSRPCVATALTLYRAILDRIEEAGHDAVLHRRVAVPRRQRAAAALTGALRVTAARLTEARTPLGNPADGPSPARTPHRTAAAAPADSDHATRRSPVDRGGRGSGGPSGRVADSAGEEM